MSASSTGIQDPAITEGLEKFIIVISRFLHANFKESYQNVISLQIFIIYVNVYF